MMIKFDRKNGMLIFPDRVVSLSYRDARVLEALMLSQGQIVKKTELMGFAWPDIVVTQASLKKSIYFLRMALAGECTVSEVIITVPRIGYKLLNGFIQFLEPQPIICHDSQFVISDVPEEVDNDEFPSRNFISETANKLRSAKVFFALLIMVATAFVLYVIIGYLFHGGNDAYLEKKEYVGNISLPYKDIL